MVKSAIVLEVLSLMSERRSLIFIDEEHRALWYIAISVIVLLENMKLTFKSRMSERETRRRTSTE